MPGDQVGSLAVLPGVLFGRGGLRCLGKRWHGHLGRAAFDQVDGNIGCTGWIGYHEVGKGTTQPLEQQAARAAQADQARTDSNDKCSATGCSQPGIGGFERAYQAVKEARDIVLQTQPVVASPETDREPTGSRPSGPELAARQTSQRTEVTA